MPLCHRQWQFKIFLRPHTIGQLVEENFIHIGRRVFRRENFHHLSIFANVGVCVWVCVCSTKISITIFGSIFSHSGLNYQRPTAHWVSKEMCFCPPFCPFCIFQLRIELSAVHTHNACICGGKCCACVCVCLCVFVWKGIFGHQNVLRHFGKLLPQIPLQVARIPGSKLLWKINLLDCLAFGVL